MNCHSALRDIESKKLLLEKTEQRPQLPELWLGVLRFFDFFIVCKIKKLHYKIKLILAYELSKDGGGSAEFFWWTTTLPVQVCR